jgi:hypothetical protein
MGQIKAIVLAHTMPDPSGWFDNWSQKILGLFSRREVKTPLAFFFRCVWAIIVIVGLGVYLAVPADRIMLAWIGAGFLVFLVVVVGIFAWFKPKNLVYGETGHRAEFRLALGTEKREFSAGEVVRMPGIPNPASQGLSKSSETS